MKESLTWLDRTFLILYLMVLEDRLIEIGGREFQCLSNLLKV